MTVRKSPPSLRRHKPSQQAVVTLNGRDHYLGPWPVGQKQPPAEVRDAYDALVAEWLANGRRTTEASPPPITVAELILQFWARYATVYYRHPDGSPTSEQSNYKLSLRPLRRLFGKLPAAEFSPLKLKSVRQSLIDAGVSRGVINQRVGRMKRLFKWGTSEELVPESVYRGLLTVEGLKAGRSEARETDRVEPVPDEHVEAVLPYLPSPLQGLVRVQRLTGMRPGEAAQMRGRDLDTTADVWVYKPPRHKTAWRGKERVVPIGPKGQEVLRPFLKPDLGAYLFSPADAREELFAAKRAARKTKVQPSQVCRRKTNPKRQPAAFYSRHTYASAVARACVKAGVPHWHPNRLRHSRATEVRGTFGLEAAQVILGHAKANVTEVYAERNLTLATRVAAQTG
jgi:integrase